MPIPILTFPLSKGEGTDSPLPEAEGPGVRASPPLIKGSWEFKPFALTIFQLTMTILF
jgi:hypothetical protein